MRRLHLSGLVLVFLVLACEEDLPEGALPLGSRVELAAGDVWLKVKDTKVRVITGAMLPQEAAVLVGEGGRALLRLETGAGAFLRSNTEVDIQGNSLKLKKGELWADVPAGDREMGRFWAGSVSITASDAGLDIAMDKDRVTVYVARGLAVVSAPSGRTEVQSGERVVVKGKAKPKVEPVAFFEDWTGGMADRELFSSLGGKAAGRIYGIDRTFPGSPPKPLQIVSEEVKIVIRDGIAHTIVDQRFFNPSSTNLEGWYWFTIPEGASVERFALEVNGALVEGEMVERKQAKAAYEEAVRRAFDPALLEWIDGHTFRARIFPIPPTSERRVVLAYSELLPLADGVYRYVYPMAANGDVTIQEFSLEVDLGDKGTGYKISTLQDARVEKDSARISMRRSGFSPRADFLLELTPNELPPPLRAMRFSASENEADYVMMRYSPEVEWNTLKKVPGDLVVVLDTSAGGDESERQMRSDVVEAILRALSAGDRFAVVAADLAPRVIYPEKGLAKASDENVSIAVEKLAEVFSAGATDLGEIFSTAFDLLYDAEQPAVVYVGDGRATVGETSSKDLADRLRRALGDARARLFTIAVGADANIPMLDRLARVGGGRLFQINTPDDTVSEALRFVGMVKTPTITDLSINAGSGLDQVFTTASGKLSEGEEVILVARTHHALPAQVEIEGRLGGKKFKDSYDLDVEKGARHGYIPMIWARQYLNRLMGDNLEKNRGRIISLGLNYSLMTPFTSFLVLESDAAYHQQGIQRRRRFTSIINESRSEVASATDALSIPLFAFGCASDKEDASHEILAPQAKPEMMAKSVKPSPVLSDSPRRAREEEAVPNMARRKTIARPKDGVMSADLDDALSSPGEAGSMGGRGIGYGRGQVALKGKLEKKRRMPSSSRPKPSRLGTTGSKERNDQETAQIAHGNETPSKPSLFKKGVCSDAAARPLAERRILWGYRLRKVTEPGQYARVFFEAGGRCELPHWRDRRIMLDLIESRAVSPGAVQGILSAFSSHKRIQQYLRRKILRRTLNPDVTMGLHFPGAVDWTAVAAGLAAIRTEQARVEELRGILEKHPNDPVGRGMLVRLLFEMGAAKEAMAEATRLRRDGLAGPMVLEILCDLQADANLLDQARRTCSELVEFNPRNPAARERLGDLFLRHGWYDAAYRQYQSLVAMLGRQPIALLRLAIAAAGMGKVDEALRIERKVATGDGEPGPHDPRRFARLHSAARLAKMLRKAQKEKNKNIIQALERSLKRTQVFSGSATLVLLVFEDFQSGLTVTAKREDTPYPISEQIFSPETGLVMLDLGQSYPEDLRLYVGTNGAPLSRPVSFTLLTITYDGKKFSIHEQKDKMIKDADPLSLAS